MSSAREKILGIDLGTTNSAAAVVEAGRPVVIPSAEGATPAGKMFPSVVAFTKDGQLLVGDPARRQVVTNPDGTIFEIKRKMGTDYRVSLNGKDYSPEQLSSYILQKIKHDAEVFLGYPVKKAVITVPAHFNDNQSQATKDAGEIAGLEVVRIINEPTAASLAYGLDKSEKEMKILVFSFGGGTHDATIMEFGKGVFQVLATSGDTQTGGTDIDRVIIQVLLDDFRSKTGIDLSSDRTAMARLKEAAEQAKIQLSNLTSTDVDLPFIASDSSGPKNLHYTLDEDEARGGCEAHRIEDREHHQEGHERRQADARPGGQGDTHRRDDQDAAGTEVRRRCRRQARRKGGRPDGGGRHRRGHPGGCPGGGDQGHTPA